MSTLRKFSLFVFAVGCFVQGDPVSYVLIGSWMSQAQALIGRPATPVASPVWHAARRGVVWLAYTAAKDRSLNDRFDRGAGSSGTESSIQFGRPGDISHQAAGGL